MPDGDAGCVLIRALEPLEGLATMQQARGLPARPAPSKFELRLIASGPGRLTQAFSITRERDNGKDITSAASDLRIVNDGFVPKDIVSTPRIGIRKATEELLRFAIAGNAYVSGRRTLSG